MSVETNIPKRTRSLRTRMVLTFSAATALWLGIIAGSVVLGIGYGLGGQMSDLRQGMRFLAESEQEATEIGRRVAAGENPADIGRDTSITEGFEGTRLRIIRADGTVLFDSATGGPPETVGDVVITPLEVLSLIPSGDPNYPFRAIGRQIVADNEIWGYYFVTFQPGSEFQLIQSEVPEIGHRFARVMIMGFIISVFVVYLWFMLFAQRVVLPIQALSEYVLQIGTGETDEHAEVYSGTNEILELTRSIQRMVADLNESRRAEKQADDRRRLVVSALGHDLRTPLAAIRSHAEALADRASSDPEASAATIIRRSAHMQRLISDLLAYASLGTMQAFPRETFDLAELVRESVIEQLSRLEALGFAVDVDIPDRKILVSGHRQSLQRVIDNLMANVLSHAAEGLWLAVSMHERVGRVRISVEDHGPGLPAGVEVFEAFQTGSQERSGSGSGIGLAVVQDVVRAHGGACEALTNAAGGCTVWFEVPTLS
ncbi:MAG: sensor histidine kinase [Spirochaetaceae bacterium]|nr:MAG: sensor histidine kinase [Spirochaetaceae bacterium]